MALALEVKNLTKSYGSKQVLRGVNFEISEGECVSLLGPNGAGKTTCISVLLHLLKKDSGELVYFSQAANKQLIKNKVACTPQNCDFPPQLSTREVLQYVNSLNENPISEANFHKKFKLESFLNTQAEKLSGGQKRLLALACAFAQQSDLLLLDEPTVGLDNQTRKYIWTLITEFTQNGGSVLLTTHYLEEAEILSDRIAVIYDGEIIQFDKLETIKENFNFKKINFQSKDKIEINKLKKNGDYFELYTQNTERDLKELLKYDIQKLTVIEPSLDEILPKVIEKAL
ncbi:MAG: ATP-binding cassette domain-containing protein [Bdellovibrionales bacterium]